MGELLAVISLIMFSSNVILTKFASEKLEIHLGFLISVMTNVIVSSLLLLIQFSVSGQALDWNSTGFIFFLLTGFFNIFLGRWAFFDAIVKLGPAKASSFQVSNPLFTFIIAVFFLGEHLTGTDLISIFLALLGLFFVSYVPRVFLKERDEQGLIPGREKRSGLYRILQSGIWLALISAMSYGIGNVFRGMAVQQWNQPILGALIGSALGMLLHILTSTNRSRFLAQIKESNRTGVILYILCGFFTTLAHISVIASMRYIPISVANLIFMSTPVLVIPFSYFFLKNKEGITIRNMIGSAMVLIGIGMLILL